MMAQSAKTMAGVKFVFVNQAESGARVSSFLNDQKIDLETVILDLASQFASHYTVPGLPATLFIDGGGNLRSVTFGEISKETLATEVEDLITSAETSQ